MVLTGKYHVLYALMFYAQRSFLGVQSFASSGGSQARSCGTKSFCFLFIADRLSCQRGHGMMSGVCGVLHSAFDPLSAPSSDGPSSIGIVWYEQVVLQWWCLLMVVLFAFFMFFDGISSQTCCICCSILLWCGVKEVLQYVEGEACSDTQVAVFAFTFSGCLLHCEVVMSINQKGATEQINGNKYCNSFGMPCDLLKRGVECGCAR